MMNLPMKSNKHNECYSVRITEELKRKQLEMNDANINVSQIVRDAIEQAYCQFKSVSNDWENLEVK